MAFLATLPNRFKYVHTPTHGSWLNIVETLFGKMARTFLRHIRVQSWSELRERILMGIAEINQAPVVHRWKKFETLLASIDTVHWNDILVGDPFQLPPIGPGLVFQVMAGSAAVPQQERAAGFRLWRRKSASAALLSSMASLVRRRAYRL